MNDAARIAAIAELGARLEGLKGFKVEIVELVSWRPDAGFERHSTVRAEFSFTVKSIAWQTSGGHFVLHGDEGQCFMLGTTKLANCSLDVTSITVDELYGECAGRRSTIRVRA
jgi:hypothetical protein